MKTGLRSRCAAAGMSIYAYNLSFNDSFTDDEITRILGSLAFALRDADDLTRVLERHGAELVLHGHIHRELIAPLPGPADRHGVSVGVPSASAGLTIGHAPLARYHLFTITRGDGSTRITLTIRGLAAAGGGVVDLGHRELLTRPDRHSTAEGPSPAARRP